MKSRRFLVAVGLLGLLASVAQASFRPTAQLGLSFGTGAGEQPQFVITREDSGECEPVLSLEVANNAFVQIQTEGGGVQLEATHDEQVVSGVLRGVCHNPVEFRVDLLTHSQTVVQPSLQISSSMVTSGEFERSVLFFFPSAGDQIRLESWREVPLSLDSEPPETSFLANWVGLVPAEGWQQYWQSSLTWPESNSDFSQPELCHTLPQVFFSPEEERPCLARGNEAVSFHIPTIRLWYGWQNPETAHFLVPAVAEMPLPGELRITEVMWAGSFSTQLNYANDEWIELYNASDHYLSLNTLGIRNARASGGTLFFPNDLKIAPSSFFIVGKPTGETLLRRRPDWETRNISLSNTEAGLSLETPTGVVIDALPSGQWAAGENDVSNKARASAQLRHLSLPGTAGESWSQCSRGDEDRCWQVTEKDWKEDSAKNRASPWQFSVL